MAGTDPKKPDQKAGSSSEVQAKSGTQPTPAPSLKELRDDLKTLRRYGLGALPETIPLNTLQQVADALDPFAGSEQELPPAIQIEQALARAIGRQGGDRWSAAARALLGFGRHRGKDAEDRRTAAADALDMTVEAFGRTTEPRLMIDVGNQLWALFLESRNVEQTPIAASPERPPSEPADDRSSEVSEDAFIATPTEADDDVSDGSPLEVEESAPPPARAEQVRRLPVLAFAIAAVALTAGLFILRSAGVFNPGHAAAVTPPRSTTTARTSGPCTTPRLLDAGLGATPLSVEMYQATPSVPAWTQIVGDVPPATTMHYLITYRNGSSQLQRHVLARVNLAPGMRLVPHTTCVYNAAHPRGQLYDGDRLDQGGISLGDFPPTKSASVTFAVTVPWAQELKCGHTEMRSVGVIHPRGLDEFYNTAAVNIYRTC